MHHDDVTAEIPPELSNSLLRFLEYSIDHILAHQDAERYFAALDGIVQRSGIDQWFDARMPFWMLARSIWNQVPLPSRHFQHNPLPAPKRNDTCPCGSGKKFKRCCQPFENEHTQDLEETLPVVQLAVERFTKPQRQAAAKSAPAEVRLALAASELEAKHPGKARTLLLALLKKSGLSTPLQADAVQLLGNAYTELGHLDAGKKKMKALIPSLKPEAVFQARCWLTSRCLDDGRPQEALAHVLDAESTDPDNLIAGILKTLCLRELGADAQAQRTAQEWLPVAHEIGDREAIELLEEQASLATLEDVVAHDANCDLAPDEDSAPPSDEAYAIFGAPDEVLRALVAQLKEALKQPLYPLHFDPGPPAADDSGTQWVLILPEPVEQAQAAFYRAGQAQSVLDVELIRQHPALLQSPDFLEQLDAFSGASSNRLQAQFTELLYEQQDRLLSHILDALPPGGQLPWAWLEHRPVLRLMMQAAMAQEDPSEEIATLSELLALCPNDNLGARAPLVNALLRAEHDAEALAICERYPDDALAETRYGHVLALVRLSRLHDAERALASAYKALPKVLNYLIASKRKMPRLNPYGVTIGGADQAWYYREEMRDAFLATPGMLSWMASIKKRLR